MRKREEREGGEREGGRREREEGGREEGGRGRKREGGRRVRGKLTLISSEMEPIFHHHPPQPSDVRFSVGIVT